MRRFPYYLLLLALALLVVSCPLPNVPSGAPGASAADNPVAVETSAAGQPVLVTASGARLPIAAVEADGATVSASDAAAIVIVADVDSAKGLGGAKSAIITGTRGDGNPGIWVYSGNQFEPVVDEDSGRATTGLSESTDRDGTFRGVFGWKYRVVGMSEDGKLLAGYAENKKGFTFRGITVDPGTTVGVYWTVKKQPVRRGFMVSRAHIIGSLDPAKVAGASKPVLRWLNEATRHTAAQLKLFLLGYYQSYLTMVDAGRYDVDSAGTVSVPGTDQDGVAAVATVDTSGNVIITEVPPPPATPTGLTVGGATTSSLDVSWTASTGAASYQVYRDTSSAGSFATVAFDGAATSFTDSGLTANAAYFYEVRATNSSGSSPLSAPASGMTLASTTGPTVQIVQDFYSGSSSSNPKNLIAFSNALYFSATDGSGNQLLRKYTGTGLISTVDPAVANVSYPTILTAGGLLYVAGNNGANRLFSYDGTAASLTQVTLTPTTLTNPQYLAAMNATLYMGANDSINGQELWSWTGSADANVANINATSGQSSTPVQLTAMGSELYFSATDGSGRKLWKSDGVPAASGGTTVAVNDSSPARLGTNSPIIVYNSALYFPANDGSGNYLWTSDGVSSESVVSTSVLAQNSQMVVYNGKLYFAGNSAVDPAGDYELYSYDGANVAEVTTFHPASGSALTTSATFGVYNNVLYFGASADGTNYQLYKFDGTTVTQMHTFNASSTASPGQFAVFDNRLYFQGWDSTDGSELWVLY